MFGQTPNGQWGAQGGYSRPRSSSFNESPEVSQPQANSWSNSARPNTAALGLLVPKKEPSNWQRPSSPNVAPIVDQTRHKPSMAMPPRMPDSYKPRPTDNTTFSGQSSNLNSWSQPMPLLNRKRPLPSEEGDYPDNNFARPRSGPWVKPEPGTGGWAGSDSRPRSADWSNPRPAPPLNTWSKPSPRNDNWPKPNTDRTRPPWSNPNNHADNWPMVNSDASPDRPTPRPNAWPKSEPRTRFTQKPSSGFSKGEGNMHSRPKPKPSEPRSIFDSIITTYYVNQEKVNMPKELTSQFEPLKCGLCGVLVNSTVTAKTHYSGKVHDKKVVQFMRKWFADKGQPLPEQFKEGVSRKPSTSQFDEVRSLYCSVCDIPLTSKQHAEQHYMGKSHKRVLDGGGARKVAVPGETADPSGRFKIGVEFLRKTDPLGLNEPETPVETKPNTNPFVCQMCGVSTTSKEQLEVHLSGARHKKKLASAVGSTSANSQKVPPRPVMTDTLLATVVLRTEPEVRTESQDEPKPDFSIFRTPSGQFYCACCNVTMNSESQFGQHNDSKRHQLSVANNKAGKNATPNITTTKNPQ